MIYMNFSYDFFNCEYIPMIYFLYNLINFFNDNFIYFIIYLNLKSLLIL